MIIRDFILFMESSLWKLKSNRSFYIFKIQSLNLSKIFKKSFSSIKFHSYFSTHTHLIPQSFTFINSWYEICRIIDPIRNWALKFFENSINRTVPTKSPNSNLDFFPSSLPLWILLPLSSSRQLLCSSSSQYWKKWNAFNGLGKFLIYKRKLPARVRS